MARPFRQPLAHFGRHVTAVGSQGVGFGDHPAQLGARRRAQRMLQHYQPQVETRSQKSDQVVGPFVEVFHQHGDQIFLLDAPACQFAAVAFFSQEGLATVDSLRLQQGFVETEVLEGVERVVMNKHRNRSLGREQMRGMFNQMKQMVGGVLRRMVR
jgi:hypothetical protein